jgi:hypothetical protein
VNAKAKPSASIVLTLLAVGLAGAMAPRWWVDRNILRTLLLLSPALVLLIPAVAKVASQNLDGLRSPSPRMWAIVALCVAAIAVPLLLWTADYQNRDDFIKWHDGHMTMVQMQLVAIGRLWLPPHPLADFFDTFHVLVRPVYAPMHFPGTAILYAPTLWLGLNYWVLPLLAAGACAGLMYRITAELTDGVSGLLAAILMVSLTKFRMVSLMLLSNLPALLLGLLMTWAWLRWREKRSIGWAAALGAFSGFAAITRPLEALCFAVPIGVAMCLQMRSERQLISRKMGMTVLALVASAAPFVAIQLVFNYGVTGSLFRTPHGYYSDRDHPYATVGFEDFDAERMPESTLPQKRLFYTESIVPAVRNHRPGNIIPELVRVRLPALVRHALPQPLLLGFVAVGLVAVWRRPTLGVVIAPMVLFLAAYTVYPILLSHYLVAVAPAMILLVVAGIHVLREAFSAVPLAAILPAFGGMLLMFAGFPQANPTVVDERLDGRELHYINLLFEEDIHEPAVVLFRFHPGLTVHIEPVYNIDTAWPDDARIIRAHDLGAERNREILDYYARHQPERVFYLYDRGSAALQRLGTARSLAARARNPVPSP